jgi:hypothetical protein
VECESDDVADRCGSKRKARGINSNEAIADKVPVNVTDID